MTQVSPDPCFVSAAVQRIQGKGIWPSCQTRVETMKKSSLIAISVLYFAIATGWGQAPEPQTKFSRDPHSYRLLTVAPEDRIECIFLPKFDELSKKMLTFEEFNALVDVEERTISKEDLAKYEIYTTEMYDKNFKKVDGKAPLVDNGDYRITKEELEEEKINNKTGKKEKVFKFITLKDWQEQKLPKVRFLYLDRKEPFGFLSRDELDADTREIRREDSIRYGIEESFHDLDTNGDNILNDEELAAVVTLKDWEKYYLTAESFHALDQRTPLGVLTKDEVNDDPYQGDTVLYQQGQDLINKRCKDNVQDYKEKLEELKQKGYTKISSAECVLDKTDKIGTANLCQVSREDPWTKTYIQERDGYEVVQKVDLGNYNLLLLQDYERDSSLVAYIALVILVGIVVVVTTLVSFFAKAS